MVGARCTRARLCGVPYLHVHVVLPVSLPALLLVHGQRVKYGVGHVGYVPGVDQQRARTKALGAARSQVESGLGQVRWDHHAIATSQARRHPRCQRSTPAAGSRRKDHLLRFALGGARGQVGGLDGRTEASPCHPRRVPCITWAPLASQAGRQAQAPPSDAALTCAAPANSDSTSTPALSDWQATYS